MLCFVCVVVVICVFRSSAAPQFPYQALQELANQESSNLGEDGTTRKPTCGPVHFPGLSCEELPTATTALAADAPFNVEDLLANEEEEPLPSSPTEPPSTPPATTTTTATTTHPTTHTMPPITIITTTVPPTTTTPLIVTYPRHTEPTVVVLPPQNVPYVPVTTPDPRLVKRVSKSYRSYYRNVPKRRPVRIYKFRPMRLEASSLEPTSSTIPYGWESTSTSGYRLSNACKNFAKCEDQNFHD